MIKKKYIKVVRFLVGLTPPKLRAHYFNIFYFSLKKDANTVKIVIIFQRPAQLNSHNTIPTISKNNLSCNSF